MKIFPKLLMLSIFSSSFALAGATLTLEGQLQATSDTHFVVKVKNQYYHVKRQALTQAQQESFQKFGLKVSGTVPLESIDQVSNVPGSEGSTNGVSETPEHKPNPGSPH